MIIVSVCTVQTATVFIYVCLFFFVCHLIVFTNIGHAILFSETFEMDISEDRASKIKNKK